ncbi:MAG TPA: dihydrodipicolinate synthase family protein [Anaerolineales bacterium]|nr:dihydrodipicolinate synthase family protein [Anaerolineales bacterium]
MIPHLLSGVYAAAITPCLPDGTPDFTGLLQLLTFLAERGCHGALISGTTGEGPSFSAKERLSLWEAASAWRKGRPDFRLLAGTGTPSLSETKELNHAAFRLGFDAVVVLPPFYFRNASENGLFEWFADLIEASVPVGKYLLGYHIPVVSGVSLPLSLLQRLAVAYPAKFGGLKDSSGSLDSAAAYVAGLPGNAVLVGNDKLLASGLAAGTAGCITALANLRSPELRHIYDAFQRGDATSESQAALDRMRAAMDNTPPAPAYIKALLHAQHNFSFWSVRLPLQDFTPAQITVALKHVQALETAIVHET